MSIKFKLSSAIYDILFSWDFLGFDYSVECAEAILIHDDWQTRWDLSEATIDDLNAVNEWREKTLEANDTSKKEGDMFEDSLFTTLGNALKPNK